MSGYFVTGTDTGAGKTLVASALLHAFSVAGKSAVGMKPVAAGCEAAGRGLRCADVEQLKKYGNVAMPDHLVNPYAFAPAIAPHLAAAQAGVTIELEWIAQAFHELRRSAEIVIVEGVGGFKVPLNDTQDTADLARMLGLPVILVVGMRLGCINHALLTVQAVRQQGLPLAGWVASQLDPGMTAFHDNVQALEARIDAPLIATAMHMEAPDPVQVAAMLRLDKCFPHVQT